MFGFKFVFCNIYNSILRVLETLSQHESSASHQDVQFLFLKTYCKIEQWFTPHAPTNVQFDKLNYGSGTRGFGFVSYDAAEGAQVAISGNHIFFIFR